MKIETERLIIRDFNKGDINDSFEYLSNPFVMKHIEPVFTYTQAVEFIEIYGIDKKSVFAVEEKSLGKVIGHIIFHEFNNTLEYELGWIFNEKFHGLGYAREVSLALFEYGFNELQLEYILAETVLENKKSVMVMESLGMKLSKKYKEDLPVWVICKNDYLKLK